MASRRRSNGSGSSTNGGTRLPFASPAGARVTRFRLGDDELAVLSFPIADPKLPDTITAAEKAVVGALLNGLSNAEIARMRGTSARTVANQVASVFRKLGVTSRAELIGRLSD